MEGLMDINEAKNIFNKLLIESKNKTEIKVYKRFIEIFDNLKNREFTKNQIKSLDEKLEPLKIVSGSKHQLKFYKLQLKELQKYLKDEFSLIPKGYYTSLGIAVGANVGTVLGLLPKFWKTIFGIESVLERSLGIALGVSIGTFIGMVIGKNKDLSAEKHNRVLN